MAVLYISEAEAVRDIVSLLAKVRAGDEVVIENEDTMVALLVPPAAGVGEPGYDEWFRSEVLKGLDCDPATDIDGDVVEAYFAKKREASMRKLQRTVA